MKFWKILVPLGVLVLTGCDKPPAGTPIERSISCQFEHLPGEMTKCTKVDRPKPIGMPNPASASCVRQGGRLEIRNETGGQIGYCYLPDGRVVEEWALFRSSRS